MFDIGPSELLLIVVVAVLVIGPKDLPLALRTAGKWIGKMRKISGHFRAGLDTMIREAEMEELEKKWAEQNERVMREHPNGGPGEPEPTGAYPPPPLPAPLPAPATAESRAILQDNPDEYRDMPFVPDPPAPDGDTDPKLGPPDAAKA
ncbi:MAG: twin arginine-targeting protein translocase TatB [Sphingomonadales bacterium 32-68-7]|nr:MAG: twin arginine-targeting protein translocase TatB [Sphingomonadales bacterium 12-68-11]OYX08900.1 MAG: twin arginine-targeting protein translocase TatB [Sphingomonadales bacterium 32-68-7]